MDIDQDTFIVGRDKLEAGQSLAPDPSAYVLLHALQSDWPCLSLDVVPDQLGSSRSTYPATMFAVAGTQADSAHPKENRLMVMKLSGLSRIEHEGSESEDDEEDDEEDAEPILETKSIPLTSTTNRVRAFQCPQASSSQPARTLTAAMMESGQVLIHDVTTHLTSFDVPGTVITPAQGQPVSTIRAHKSTEGYAIDWSAHQAHASGSLLTGDVSGKIFLTTRHSGGSFTTESTPFTGHRETVEELQWSPSEANVFASGGNDGCVKIYDTRSKSKRPALSCQVSSTDVNVLSWSNLEHYILASGHDDGSWSVWDLRAWKDPANLARGSKGSTPTVSNPSSSAVATFSFHKEQITGLEWHPTDNSIMLVCSGDGTVTQWDLAVELDDEESRYTADVKGWPPQLLFQHHMEEVKEGHWHPQIPGCVMATGGSGFG